MSRSVKSGGAAVCRSCQTLDPRMPKCALVRSAGRIMVEVLPASCGVRSRHFQLRVERFEVKSFLRDGSPNRRARRHVKHKQSLPVAHSVSREAESGSSFSLARSPSAEAARLPVCAGVPVLRRLPNERCTPRTTAKALWRQVHLGSSASAQSWLPRAGLSCTLWSSMNDATLLLLFGSIAQCQPSAAGLLVPNRGSNPSVEGTSTSKLRLLAAAPHVKR